MHPTVITGLTGFAAVTLSRDMLASLCTPYSGLQPLLISIVHMAGCCREMGNPKLQVRINLSSPELFLVRCLVVGLTKAASNSVKRKERRLSTQLLQSCVKLWEATPAEGRSACTTGRPALVSVVITGTARMSLGSWNCAQSGPTPSQSEPGLWFSTHY